MPISVNDYINNVNRLFVTGHAREHSYRGDLQNLLISILPNDILVTNEPARVECGAPDYVLTKGKANIPVGYIEAKDIKVDLKNKSLKEQFERYKAGLSNLVITDYLKFEFYKDGEFITEISIGKVENDKIVPIEQNFGQFQSLIQNFAQTVSQTIRSSSKLAKLMAGKARLMANVIEKSLDYDDEAGKRSSLKGQMLSFQQMLIHDINNRSFADIYAQTIAYGMFAARYHDPTLPTFSRMEAAHLIPKSNPFLRKLFQDIAGFDVDQRIVWIVDELVTIFLATDVASIMKTFGRSTKLEDPIIHFYETFLAEYDKSLRKTRGVWYTPQPVVNFIVRAVDDILKDEFGLSQGLADSSKTKIKVKVQSADKRHRGGVTDFEKEVHRVQILDPATGTGTFLAETIKHIYSKFIGMEGMWPNYVKKNLIPRMNGFELLMASYAMAHLKMDMLLTETGYLPEDDQRFRIFLTNSLEEAHPDTNTLFSSWLSDESNQANGVKRDAPVMVIIGNPPYSGESSNNSKWIDDLIGIYKKDHNGERIPDTKWLNNDYVKFIRYGQHFIEKNGSGILAYITDNSFLDSISFRGMRSNLLKTYDKIFILNLHGNSKKKESSPDGGLDQNVFDIMQGVSISLLIKTGHKADTELGAVFHYDLYGKRESKYNALLDNSFSQIQWNNLKPVRPYFFLVPKDFSAQQEYDTFIKIDTLLNLNGVGVCSKRDDTAIKFDKSELVNVLTDFQELSESQLKVKYKTERSESRDKKTSYAKANIARFGIAEDFLQEINYRPFDTRWTYFTNQSRGFLAYPVYAIMKHFRKDNLGLVVSKKSRQLSLGYIYITKSVTDLHILDSAADSTYTFPLYLYFENTNQQSIEIQKERVPNLNMEIVQKIADLLEMIFTPEKENKIKNFAPIDILDYIYAVLHSPSYRKKYKEFLKIDFPRVPYPTDSKTFFELVDLGRRIRELHLLELSEINDFVTSYAVSGSNIVEKPIYKDGKVYINKEQYFDNVPELAWNFYIGGYQPAQKWLKDRENRELDIEDVMHYQKMIVALTETDRLMKEVDCVLGA